MKLLLACLSVILSGCGTVGLKVSENVTRVPDGRGIVIFSTCADSTSLSFSTSLILVDAASRKFYDKVIIQVDAPVAASHVPGEHAHIRSLELPQGSYFLVPRIANSYTKMVEYPVYEFLVRSGEITYLGNVRLSGDRLQLSGASASRDIEYFMARNPDLRAQKVDVRLLTVADVIKRGDGKRFETNGIIMSAP